MDLTTNFRLKKPAVSDMFKTEHMNDNMDALDLALSTLSGGTFVTPSKTRYVNRKGTEAELPILFEGELGYSTDTRKVYIGGVSSNLRLATQSDLDNLPITVHTHVANDITDLTTVLDAKANTVHAHTKADVGLGNVDNTSDANKPLSNAMNTALGAKANTVHTHTKADVGLGNVDNTSDANKPLSNAMNTALSGKANTVHAHNKADIGLGNVDNTSDANKPLSSAMNTALAGKYDKASITCTQEAPTSCIGEGNIHMTY